MSTHRFTVQFFSLFPVFFPAGSLDLCVCSCPVSYLCSFDVAASSSITCFKRARKTFHFSIGYDHHGNSLLRPDIHRSCVFLAAHSSNAIIPCSGDIVRNYLTLQQTHSAVIIRSSFHFYVVLFVFLGKHQGVVNISSLHIFPIFPCMTCSTLKGNVPRPML